MNAQVLKSETHRRRLVGRRKAESKTTVFDVNQYVDKFLNKYEQSFQDDAKLIIDDLKRKSKDFFINVCFKMECAIL
jgi:hypothetical protein